MFGRWFLAIYIQMECQKVAQIVEDEKSIVQVGFIHIGFASYCLKIGLRVRHLSSI